MGKTIDNWAQMTNTWQYSQQSQNIFEKSVHNNPMIPMSLNPLTQNLPSNISITPVSQNVPSNISTVPRPTVTQNVSSNISIVPRTTVTQNVPSNIPIVPRPTVTQNVPSNISIVPRPPLGKIRIPRVGMAQPQYQNYR